MLCSQYDTDFGSTWAKEAGWREIDIRRADASSWNIRLLAHIRRSSLLVSYHIHLNDLFSPPPPAKGSCFVGSLVHRTSQLLVARASTRYWWWTCGKLRSSSSCKRGPWCRDFWGYEISKVCLKISASSHIRWQLMRRPNPHLLRNLCGVLSLFTTPESIYTLFYSILSIFSLLMHLYFCYIGTMSAKA
jgi:hypothetical protein